MKGQNRDQMSPGGQHSDESIGGILGVPGIHFAHRQSYGDITSPTIDENQQLRSTPTTSPSHVSAGVKPSLSASSSPLHHLDYLTDDKGILYPQYGYSNPPRGQDLQLSLTQNYSQELPLRSRLRNHPHQRKADRAGGVYYNVHHPPGRQSASHPNYSQGKKNTINEYII